MKKLLVSMLAATALLASAGISLAAEDVFKMNMTTIYMDKHPVVQKIYIPWMEKIKAETNGRVEITYFNPGTACPEGEIFDSVKKGQISLGGHQGTRNPGKLITLGVFAMPTENTTAAQASDAFWKMYQASPEMQKDFEGIKLLTLHSSAPTHFAFNGPEVKKLTDLAGKKILSPSGEAARMARALGANPITLPFGDFYLSLQRGMADGCFTPIAPMRSFKINEATKSVSLCSLAFASVWLGMNQELYDSLPADIQKVFNENTGEQMSRAIAAVLDAADQDDLKAMQDSHGIKVYKISTTDRSKMILAITPALKDAWKERMKSLKDVDPEELYTRYIKIANKL